MYTKRLRVLKKAYKAAERNNTMYKDAMQDLAKYKSQLEYVRGLGQALAVFNNLVTTREHEWREKVLHDLECEIMQDLAYVYPSDGYSVNLSSRILRGKIHIEATAKSPFTGDMSGDVADSQGRLFQQVVSFAALIGIMKILGVETVYIDEAFSGASKKNVVRINNLLKSVQERGFNIVLIAQDLTMAKSISANTLILSRSLDNKTSILQLGGLT